MNKSLVNENKLFSVIGNFFTSKDNLMLELIQNALRAGAKNIAVKAPHSGPHPFTETVDPGRIISISDDGRGIGDIFSLLGIAFSDWDPEVESQQPAGMGFLQLLALSERVHIRSRFGELLLDSKLFLTDPDYRQSVMAGDYAADPEFSGTEIHALMKLPAWMYLKSDLKWYAGCLGIALNINGQEIASSGMRDRVEKARATLTLYTIGRYKANPILIEVGVRSDIGCLTGSLINWYGQLIPVGFGSCLAGNSNIRVYYEVKRGTPLTPRYPDRNSLNYEEKYLELQAYVNGEVEKLLLTYFAGELPKPVLFGCVSLLGDMYKHSAKELMNQIPWLPVRRNAFRDHESWFYTLARKSELAGYSFCVETLQVDEEYSLGADTDKLRIVQVEEHVAPYLKNMGLPEVVAIKAENPPRRTINLEPLRLRIVQADAGEEAVTLQEAVLCNVFNDAYVYAPAQDKVLDVFDDYGDEALFQDDDRDWDVIRADVRRDIVDAMAAEYELCSQSKFEFLPRHREIKRISFRNGQVLLEYDDGGEKTLSLLEAS